MTGERTLYLARHGRTALNAEGRLRGLADPPLDEIGRAEVRRLAADLRGRGIGLVLSSPLNRARTTAGIIGAVLGVPHHVDERFTDRDYGPQTGRLRTEVEAEFGSVDAAPGVEPVDAVLARSRPALDAVLDEDPESIPLIVTHDAVIRPLLLAIDRGVVVQAPTASWDRVTRIDGRWAVRDIDRRPAAESDGD